MCSIIGSYNIDDVKELAELNRYRGQHSYSIAVVDSDGLQFLERGFGPLPTEKLADIPPGYIICHQQAPTTDARDSSAIHPADFDGRLLWHNGIIKDKQIKEWQTTYVDSQPWDTMWLNRIVSTMSFPALSSVDGTFACAYYNGDLFIFRNANSPLFKSGTTISSTKFGGSTALPHGRVYRLVRSKQSEWEETPHIFTTKEQFFWTPV